MTQARHLWSKHKQLLMLPTAIGCTVFVQSALWQGLVVSLVALAFVTPAYHFLYDSYLPENGTRTALRTALISGVLISAQIAYWGGLLAIASSLRSANAN